MADAPMPGRGLVTRRAVGDVVRRAALGSYGVISVSGPRPWHTALAWIGRATPGVRVRLGPPLTVDLYLSVARGVPIAEVARNVDSAVRYGVQRALDREIDALAIHVDRLRTPAAHAPTEPVATASGEPDPAGTESDQAPSGEAEPTPAQAAPPEGADPAADATGGAAGPEAA